jgi:hypothetical protein
MGPVKEKLSQSEMVPEPKLASGSPRLYLRRLPTVKLQ